MTGVAFENPSEEEIKGLIERAHRIAVVGLSPKPHRDSHRVSLYMQERGYEIIPLYPREERILGAQVYRRVQDVPGSVDLVNVFRRSAALPRSSRTRSPPGRRRSGFSSVASHEHAARPRAGAGRPRRHGSLPDGRSRTPARLLGETNLRGTRFVSRSVTSRHPRRLSRIGPTAEVSVCKGLTSSKEPSRVLARIVH